jgi:hypothetical protein
MGRSFAVPFLAFFVVSCSSSSAAPAPANEVRMSFDRPDFFAAPWPSDDLRKADGTVDMTAFPDPNQTSLAEQAVALVSRDAHGFAEAGAVFFTLTGTLDPVRLPSMMATTQPGSSVFLVAVDATSPDYMKPYPIDVEFATDGGPFGAPNMLSLLPLQGAPLRPATKYAAVVLKNVASPALGASQAMSDLVAGRVPASLPAAAASEYASALAAVTGSGISADDIAALSVFTTDAPLSSFQAVVTDILAQPRPVPSAFVKTDDFPDYCVYRSTVAMPDYQEGTPPFDSTGGDWTFDATGKPVLQRNEPAWFDVTVPKQAIPSNGFPTVVFVRAGGGTNRPLVDRGAEATNGGPAIVPGSGPALEFARVGYAGVEIDGPLEGLRNTTNGNEDFLIFNVFNGDALRDNVRESAVELVLQAHMLDSISFDVSDCAGATGTMKFDTSQMAIMGHSMGASILPLAFAFEPRFQAAILSGAGASWVENILYKQMPLDVAPAIGLLLHYPSLHATLTDHDPALTLLQWAIEPADSQVYARGILREPPAGAAPRHVLMEQGIVDHYILPPIADAISAPLGLDLAGPELDTMSAELSAMPGMTPVSATFPFSGRSTTTYPVHQNFGGVSTAVLVQNWSDGIEDGHEVIFQTDPPKYQYKCFLASLLTGAPSVPDGAGMTDDAPCP